MTDDKLTTEAIRSAVKLMRDNEIAPLMLTKRQALATGMTEDEWSQLERTDDDLGIPRQEVRAFYMMYPNGVAVPG